MELKDIREDLPNLPGCYLFKTKAGKVLYVGKAKDLRKRVSQYFQFRNQLDPKIQKMLGQADRVDTETVGSEVEALILEANLIKKYKPKYNALLKDDKSYSWIVITKEPFPRVFTARKIKSFEKERIFGPYPSGSALNQTLKFLGSIFPYRKCKHPLSGKLDDKDLNQIKRCFYYHLGRCVVEPDGTVSSQKYNQNIRSIILFLQSRKHNLIEKLEKEMKLLSRAKKFEEAAKIRDQVDALNTISKRVYVEWGQDEFDVRKSQRQRARNGVKQLVEILRRHKVVSDNQTEAHVDNSRIECFDISNIQGKFAVGSMVVFEAGLKKSSDYRRFKIRTKDTPDDYKMLAEVFSRRFARTAKAPINKKQDSDRSFSKLPSLILVDGGKGQRNVGEKVLENKPGMPEIPIIGLSKRHEELWIKDQKRPVILPKGSDTLFLVERIRDEAHRFAITYHRKLRKNELRVG